jgi:putative thioredoxin
MSKTPYIFDATTANFAEQVIAKSHQLPVLVDFWAGWCQPCQVLMPVLQRLAEDYGGKFLLAKVNADTEQALAVQYRVRGLPTLKLFRHGEIVDELVGVQPESVIRIAIDRHVVRESDRLVEQAQQAQAQGQQEQSLTLLQQAVEMEPENHQAAIALATALLTQGATAEAEHILQTLPPDVRAEEPASGMLAQIEFAAIAHGTPPKALLQQRLTTDPEDSEARYLLGIQETLAGNYETALEQFMELLKRNQKYRDEAARKALLAVFNILGAKHELVNHYRRQMFRYLH